MLRKLAEIANKLDSLKLYKEADKIDNVIKKMAQMDDEFDFAVPMQDFKYDVRFTDTSGDIKDYIYSSEPPNIEESALKKAIINLLSRLYFKNKKEGVIIPESLEVEWKSESKHDIEHYWSLSFSVEKENNIERFDDLVHISLTRESNLPYNDVEGVNGIGHDGMPKTFAIFVSNY